LHRDNLYDEVDALSYYFYTFALELSPSEIINVDQNGIGKRTKPKKKNKEWKKEEENVRKKKEKLATFFVIESIYSASIDISSF
jgi:hypothetical protein